MSSALQSSYPPTDFPGRQAIAHVRNASASLHAPTIPSGTFAPGTKVHVGGHRVVVEKYLSEGGFAHVYLVRLPKPVDGEATAVLKRVAVPDKEALTNMRTEVETMEKLKGHRQIVKYIDSHASQLKGGGYEVFLLMEYCDGGGLIDFMNTRLQNRLTEPEIIKIFSDIAQGVACMHYLKPPLLHRDLKVENVLISSKGGSRQFKLCDFGSAAVPRPAATNAAEGRLIEEDVQKHTTMQYRSPEMIDVYRKQPIDEKSDIWALGVLLYKLCYYTTPFEEQGQMAILNASFKYPGYPQFTDRLKKLIAMMLQEKPTLRPNIYQVVREVCLMRGTEVPIKDIYAGRTASEARRNQQLPNPHAVAASPPTIGAYKSVPAEEKHKIPDITPMRRGRPNNLGTEQHTTRPSPSPRRLAQNDPFAALDSAPSSSADSGNLDDVSARFPSLDQFSLLHESGGVFAFDSGKTPASPQPKAFSQRVTEALADDAFAVPPPSKEVPTKSKSLSSQGGRIHTGTQTPEQFADSSGAKPKSVMVSSGTMTSPPSLPNESSVSSGPHRPTLRFPPPDQRSSSQPRSEAPIQDTSTITQNTLLTRPALSQHRSKSQSGTFGTSPSAASPRSSLESRRPLSTEPNEELSRPKITASGRPGSAHLETTSRFLRNRSPSHSKSTEQLRSERRSSELVMTEDGGEPSRISSNVEFLRAMEEEDPTKRKEKRHSSGSKHAKRSSLPSISLSSTKSLLAGRFGDAFRRFETNAGDNSSVLDDNDATNNLTPIASSEAIDGRSDDGRSVDETEKMPPEVRRELERRRLSQEERRVAEAAAVYKQQVADGGGRPAVGRGRENNTRATRIQNKVQALLDESGKASPTKTAEGYGLFTASPQPAQEGVSSPPPHPPSQQQQQSQPHPKPTASNAPPSSSKPFPTDLPPRPHNPPAATASAPAAGVNERSFARPNAPPKPQALRTGGGGLASPAMTSKPSELSGRRLPQQQQQQQQQQQKKISQLDGGASAVATSSEDWEASFSKRYPSLSGLEMVETEIERGSGVRDI